MDLDPLWRMLVAAALTVPIGLERELRGKAAGLRTHVVVGTAAAAFAAVSLLAAPEGAEGADQTRIAAQVVSGIGFMGAGVIFASGGRVHGLTTAAALWGAAATGVCVGLGATDLAVAVTAVLVLFLGPVDWVTERTLGAVKREERTFQVVLPDQGDLDALQDTLADHGGEVRELFLRSFGEGVSARVVVRCRRSEAQALLRALGDLPGVSFVSDQAHAQG